MAARRFPILMYHRIEDKAYMHQNGLWLSGEHCSLQRFQTHLEQLKRGYQVLPVPEIVDRLAAGEALPENVAAITFDDGTRDHVELVLPLLIEFGLPATFFLMAGPFLGQIPPTFKMQLITGGQVPVNEVARYFFPKALHRIAPEFARQYRQGIEVPSERYIGEQFEEIRQMKYLFNYQLPVGLKDEVANEIFNDLFSGSEPEIIRKMFLSPEDVRQMVEAGMAIGCHTRSHYNLAMITNTAQVEEEVVASKHELMHATGGVTDLFAYPAGGKEGYTPTIVQLVRLHYRAAFNTGNQKDWCSTDDNLFELPRIHENYFD